MKTLLMTFALLTPAILLGADSNPDASFYKKAAEGGMAEVEMGRIAQQKAEDADVKAFGALMVKDHTAANNKLKALAESKGMTLPARERMGEMASKDKLKMLSGATFDKSYVKGMIKDHEEDIKEFQKEADSGQDPDAKAFAAATLPTLKAHLKKIRSIADKMGVGAE